MTNVPSRASIDSVLRRLLDPQARLDGFWGGYPAGLLLGLAGLLRRIWAPRVTNAVSNREANDPVEDQQADDRA